MGRKNLLAELRHNISEGIKYLGLDKYERAKQAFGNVLAKADEQRRLLQELKERQKRHYDLWNRWDKLHNWSKERAAFGFGLAEGFIERRDAGEPYYRGPDELTELAQEYCDAYAAWHCLSDQKNSIRMGKSYAALGFRKDAMISLSACDEEIRQELDKRIR